MVKKPYLSRINSNKKHTKDNNKIIIFGKYPCYNSLLSSKRTIYKILATKDSINDINIFLKNNKISYPSSKIEVTDKKYLDKFTDHNNHQNHVLIASKIKIGSQFELLEKVNMDNISNILILDQITDPYNVGSIIRSAIAFNFNIIVFCNHNSVIENSITIKASAGTFEKANLYITSNINNLIEKLKKLNYWIISLSGDGDDNIKNHREIQKKVIIIGSEGKGVRKLVKKNSDFICKININNDVESLNVSNACAIALYESSKLNK